MSTEPITQDPAGADEPVAPSTTAPSTTAPSTTAPSTTAPSPEAHDSTESGLTEPSSTAETALHQLESELSDATGEETSTDQSDSAAEEDPEEGTEEDSGRADSTDKEESTALGKTRSGGRRSDLEHEGEVAADFLEQLLDIADLDGDLEVNVEGDRAAVAIVDSEEGPAPKKLVGRDAAVLEALQELTRLAVQAETGDRSRLMLDIAGHRAGRRSELVDLARATVASVKESGERAELEPMSAFERKVVHDEVLAGGLVSESEGTEPNRYVVILPND